MNQPDLGLYIHLPFCRSKCPYCDFYSVLYEPQLAAQYVDAVLRALHTAPIQARVSTVYFGGGTPSLLGEKALCALLQGVDKAFGLTCDAEVTLEANPGTVDFPLLRGLRAGGFNRISLGLQTADAAQLRALGRQHSTDEAAQAVLWAQEAGFEHISLDLMLGIPQQTVETAVASAAYCAQLGVGHISAYLLKIEPDTPFGRCPPPCPDEDMLADGYLAVSEFLAGQGYEHYEISNFAKPGQQCRHNLKYWLCEDYLGIGPAAHSLVGGQRFYFPRDLQGFLNSPDPWQMRIEDGSGGTLEETVMLGLRLGQGLEYRALEQRFPQLAVQPMAEAARPFERAGLLTSDQRGIRLNPQGFLLSNTIIAAILESLD